MRLNVQACAVCRTDLHIVDGELPDPKLPLVLGHQIVSLVSGVSGSDRLVALRLTKRKTAVVEVPPISYTRSGDVAIAYQVLGDGPIDLVFVPEFSNLIQYWQHPLPAAFFRELASFSRLILLDKRGVGLSDRPRDLGPLETRMDDIRAVLDAVGSDRAALFGLTCPAGTRHSPSRHRRP